MAKTKKKKPTPLQQAYKKERKRIERRIRELEKKGYIFNDYDFPPPLKRATQKAVDELKRVDAATIYAKAKWVDIETGEFISGTKKREQERREAALKGIENRRKNQAAEQAFWTGEDPAEPPKPPKQTKKKEEKPKQPKQEQPAMPPDGGVIALRNFMDRINEIFAYAGGPEGLSTRELALYNAKMRARDMILDELAKKIAEMGESNVGWLLQQNSEDIQDAITAISFASREDTISLAIFKIVKFLKEKVTRELLELMNLVGEEYESWEDV